MLEADDISPKLYQTQTTQINFNFKREPQMHSLEKAEGNIGLDGNANKTVYAF